MLHSDILPEHDWGGELTQRQPSSSAVCVLGRVENSGKIVRAGGNLDMPYSLGDCFDPLSHAAYDSRET